MWKYFYRKCNTKCCITNQCIDMITQTGRAADSFTAIIITLTQAMLTTEQHKANYT